MAERRMFAKTIIDSDAFLDMSISARLLYYDLGMRADDDGFVNSPKKIMRMIGASEDDLRMLCARKFIIPFDNGVVVIKHWRIHNYIRKDTYNETPYKEQMALLELDENTAYRLKSSEEEMTFDSTLTNRQRTVDETLTDSQRTVDTGKVRLGKDRIGKDRIERMDADKPPRKRFEPPSVEEVDAYIKEQNYHVDAQRFVDYYTSNGWMVGKNHMKDWKAAVRTWERKDGEDGKPISGDCKTHSGKFDYLPDL